jgi:formyltetrahydrofolate synthetase
MPWKFSECQSRTARTRMRFRARTRASLCRPGYSISPPHELQIAMGDVAAQVGADVLILPLQDEVAELPGLPKSREKHLTIVLQKYAGLKDCVWSTEQLLTFPYHKISRG